MSDAVEYSEAARLAALGGTRQMIADAQFDALVALLVDCGAVPRDKMAQSLNRLSQSMSEKASRAAPCNFFVHPPELRDRAKALALCCSALSGH